MTTSSFGHYLKQWREIRRFSQLSLSAEADISSSHLSYLESGRARPSREMIMKLAVALQMPREATNAALKAAGFASAFPQLSADDEKLAPVRGAVAHMLASHMPLPAVAIDRLWDLAGANESAIALFEAAGVAGASNMIDALIAAGNSDVIENWEETALLTLTRLRSEIAAMGGNRTLERFASQILAHERLREFNIAAIDFSQAVIPTIFRIEGERLSLFSTIAQFGAVQDVYAADLRVELMFPASESAAEWFRRRI